MIELHGCGIFKEIFEGGREGQQIIWDPLIAHLREGVIHQPGVQPSNKSTCVKVQIEFEEHATLRSY